MKRHDRLSGFTLKKSAMNVFASLHATMHVERVEDSDGQQRKSLRIRCNHKINFPWHLFIKGQVLLQID